MSETIFDTYEKELSEAVESAEAKGEQGYQGLRNHIVDDHFDPYIMASLGIAKFDIDLASRVGIPLDWVVERALNLLQNPPLLDKQNALAGGRIFTYSGYPWGALWYRQMIAKNLRFIEFKGCASVDWEKADAAFPLASCISLDLERDSWESNVRTIFKNSEKSNGNKIFIMNPVKNLFQDKIIKKNFKGLK